MAISTAAALIGSAVIGAGTSMYGASQSKKAANQGLEAQTRANDQAIQLQRETRDQALRLQNPWIQGGQSAFDEILREYQLGPYSGGAPAPTQTGPSKTPGGFAGTSPPAPIDSMGMTERGPRQPPPPLTADEMRAINGNGQRPYTPEELRSLGLEDAYASAMYKEQAAANYGQQRPGIASPAGSAPQQSATGGPDYAAYGAANPDVAAEWQRIVSSGGGSQFNNDPNAFYASHYQTYGQSEGRPMPTSAPSQQGPQAPQQPQGPTAARPQTDLMTANRPDAIAPPSFQRPTDVPRQDFQRPADLQAPVSTRPTSLQAPTFTRQDGPTYNEPDKLNPFSFDASRIADDPGYQFRQAEALRAVNAGSAARGKLRSGDAAAALMNRASGLASQETGNAFARQLGAYQQNAGQYNADRAFGRNVFTDDRNRTDQNFNSDRAYGTDAYRYDQNRTDANFADDRNFSESRNRYDQGRLDSNFSEDRAYGENRSRYDQGRADANFADDRAYDTGIWQYGQQRQDRNFETDRNYQTNRYDTRMGNLFALSNTGQQAAGAVTNANANYANNAGSIYGSQANAAGDAAAARAQANNQMAGGLASAAGNLFSAWGGGSRQAATPATTGAWNAANGGGWQTPYQPTGTLTTMPRPTF